MKFTQLYVWAAHKISSSSSFIVFHDSEYTLRFHPVGDPWVAQRFRACLWPRARSWSPGIESRMGLPAWSLLFPLPVSLPLSLSLSIMNLKKKVLHNIALD